MSWGKTRYIALLSTAGLVLGFGISLAQPPTGVAQDPLRRVERVGTDMVRGGVGDDVTDWVGGYIQVTAVGMAARDIIESRTHERLLAMRAARVLAYRKLAERLNGVRVNSTTTVEAFRLTSDTVKVSVDATVRNAQIVEERSQVNPEDNRILGIVTLRVPMRELTRPIIERVLLEPPPPAEKVYVAPSAPLARPSPSVAPPSVGIEKPPRPAMPPERVTPTPEQAHTGLIVDASGLRGEPALAIQLKTDPDRQVVYGPHKVDREVALNIGLAQYGKTIQDGKSRTDVVGNNPMVIRPVSVEGPLRSDFVISQEDAERVAVADVKGSFLRKARVFVVLAP